MGAGSQLNSGEFSVGSGSQGTLTIQNGGAGNCNILIVASSSGAFGTVAVTGAGSELNASDGGVAEVGYGGQGRLTIADGGRVTDASATVGALLGSVGNVLVDAEPGRPRVRLTSASLVRGWSRWRTTAIFRPAA